MVFGERYYEDAKGERVPGTAQGAFFHADCWKQFQASLPTPPPDAREARICPTCGGTGVQDANAQPGCLDCGGTGYVPA